MKNRPWLQAVLLCGALLGSTISTTDALSPPPEKGDCGIIHENVQFEGARAPNGMRGKIESAEACIDLCRGETECRFWNWFGQRQMCLLFKDRTSEKPAPGYFSGDCLVSLDPVTVRSVPRVDPNIGKCLPATPGQEAPNPRIMLIGETGVGKSTLGRRLLGNKCGDYASPNFNNKESPGCAVQKIGHTMKSETSSSTWIAGKWLGNTTQGTPCFAVVDTPGIGDVKGKATDCTNFMEVAEVAREISPIDAFVLVIKGDTTRVGPKLLDQLRFFEELFGEGFWKSTVIAVSFWSHTQRDIDRRFRRGGLDERKMSRTLNIELKKAFHGIPATIPTVFIDPVYDQAYARDDEAAIYAAETAKLWENMIDSERFFCDDSCSSLTFLEGSPKLEDDNIAGGGIVAQYMGGRVTIRWTIWFGDCDQDEVRSYTVLKNNETIYEMVEAAYQLGADWEPGRGRATVAKPPSLQIVDSCSNLKPGSSTECDNLKSKYKTITLTFDPITAVGLGKYKLRNARGVSEEAELVETVDGKAGLWSQWGPCSKTCIGEDLAFGIKERTRTPSQPANGGKLFSAPTKETKSCASGTGSDTVKLCEGKPGQWSPWGPCSKSCGPGGMRERTRNCNGRVCPDMQTKQYAQNCTVGTLKDWKPVCPEISKYSPWSVWSCPSKCFNPLRRSGTSQTRTRTCKDDTPKHSDYNCQTMGQPLEETHSACRLDPHPYKTRYGAACLSGFPCDTYGEDYYWCRTGNSNGDWEYCSYDGKTTIYGIGCYDSCAKKGGTKYYWCKTSDGWDYCSPRC